MIEDSVDDFAQLEGGDDYNFAELMVEDDDDPYSYLLQTNAYADEYDEMFDYIGEFLAQISDADRERLDMLTA